MTNALANLSKSSSGDNANAKDDISLPPKPYTEYTIFFRLERTYLLQSEGIIDEEVVSSLDPNHIDPVEFPRPARYERLALPPYWYSSSHKAVIEKKRKHRKRAGRMDLQTLSKTISASWRNADQEITDYCRKLAKAERAKYKQRMEMNKVTSANAKTDVGSCVQQQALLLPKETPSIVASASPFVLAQAKQQAGHFVLPQRQSNKVAPNANGVLSLQDFVFSKPKQVASPIMPMSMPPVAAPVTVNNNMNKMRDSYNEVMGYSSSGLQNDQKHETCLQIFQLQAGQHQRMNICGAVSPSPADSPPPFTNANYLGLDHSPTQVTSSTPFANIYGGVRPENRPEKKNKRKFVRRVSAPPEFLAHEKMLALQARAAATPPEVRDADALFRGEDGPKPRKRRSMIDLNESGRGMHLDAKDLQELRAIRRESTEAQQRRRLSDSFEKELDNVRFTHVPNWEKEDADALLGFLDMPQADEPVSGDHRSSAVAVDEDEEMRMFLKDVGLEDDLYCKAI